MKICLKISFLVLSLILGAGCFAQTNQDVSGLDTAVSRIELKYRNRNNYDSTLFNIFPKKTNNKKIGLVLSGGGARGFDARMARSAVKSSASLPQDFTFRMS